MATATTTLTREVKRAILAEQGADDCRIVYLLAGCYGHYGYMADNYGVTPERCALVMRDVHEMPEYLLENYGFTVTAMQATTVMREAHEKMEEAWDTLMGY